MLTTRRLQLLTRVFPRLFGRSISSSSRVGERSQTASSAPPFFSSTDDSSAAESCSEADDREEPASSAPPQNHGVQVLRAFLRQRRSRCVGRVREQGLVPAVLVDLEKERRPIGGSTDVFISLDAKPLAALLKLIGKRDFVSRVFDMDIYQSLSSSELHERLQVLPRNLNYGPGKKNVLNVQFIRAPAGQDLKLGVPLEFLRTHLCPGLQKGGTLKILAKYVLYKCKATEVPAKIVVDMSVLEIGDRVRIQDLEVDLNCLVSEKTMVVCEIVKNVRTLKAKARRLKNELLYKKKALVKEESSSKSRSLSDVEVDASDDGDDEVVPYRFQKQGALAKKGAPNKMASTKELLIESDKDTSRHKRVQLPKTSRVVESGKSQRPSKRRLTGSSSGSRRENLNDQPTGPNVSSSMKERKIFKIADSNDNGILPSLTRKRQCLSGKGSHGQSSGHRKPLDAESDDEGGLVPATHLGLASSDSEADDEGLPRYAKRQTRTRRRETRV